MGHLPARDESRDIDPYATQPLPIIPAGPRQRHVDADAPTVVDGEVVPPYVLDAHSPLRPAVPRGGRHHLRGELVTDDATREAIRRQLTADLRREELRHAARTARRRTLRLVVGIGGSIVAILVVLAVVLASCSVAV